ncbi:MAG: N-acetyltransferase [Bacteroidota bacterium]
MTPAIIRQERPEDYQAVSQVIEAAFRTLEISDHTEHLMVDRLRHSPAFIPELSLVATSAHEIVGHILLSNIHLQDGADSYTSLALAPVSVLPSWHGKGIGSHLILEAHRIARKMGFTSVILLGHPEYYPRFGYRPASSFGISLPFEVPDENCMALELLEGALTDVKGMVIYPKEFFE